MIRLGLIGTGRWGTRYIDTISEMKGVRLAAISRKQNKYPINTPNGCLFFRKWEDLITSKSCDGVIICTPPELHVQMALKAASYNMPMVIEKPLSLLSSDTELLKGIDSKVPVIVNHIHLFSPAYEELKNFLVGKTIESWDSIGLGKGPFRSYSALHDYGPHDLAMCLDILGDPSSININPFMVDSGDIKKEHYDLRLTYPNCIAKIKVGNDSGKKRRRLSIKTSGHSIIYDDTLDEKLIIDSVPFFHLSKKKPLNLMLEAFVESIQGKKDPRCGLDLGIKITSIIDNGIQDMKTAKTYF